MPAERTVRQLKVRAPDAALARRARVLLEDALRTASLPGEGAALVLVRRIVLPPFRGSATPQTVALALEERCRTLTIFPLRADATEDEIAGAIAVRFRDPFHAHCELCARLLRGEALRAWCWPMAVPGYRAGMALAQALRAAALSLAVRQEAAAALPAWLDEVVEKGGGVPLIDGLSMADAELLDSVPASGLADGAVAVLWQALRTRAEIAIDFDPPRLSGEAPAGGATDRWDTLLRLAARRHAADDPRWRWLARVGGRLHPEFAAPRERGWNARARARREEPMTALPSESGSPSNAPVRFDAAVPAPAVVQQPSAGGDRGLGTDALIPRAGGAVEMPASPRPLVRAGAREGAGADATAGQEPRGSAPAADLPVADIERSRTRAAGLLFVLRVLEQRGLPAWLDADPMRAAAAWPARVFARLLSRLRVPADDPAWMLASDAARGGGGRDGAEGAVSANADPAAFWLRECRRWLRLGARIGLADLVLRPGLLSITRTHVDVWLDPEQADMRIRRAGLDLDPGWVPWLGRVVCFHYDRDPR
jgi:hypothetical protein